MLVETKTIYTFEKEDFEFIRKQMKEKHLKVKTICEDYKISRSYFYDMAQGRRNARELIIILNYLGIYPQYNIAKDYSKN